MASSVILHNNHNLHNNLIQQVTSYIRNNPKKVNNANNNTNNGVNERSSGTSGSIFIRRGENHAGNNPGSGQVQQSASPSSHPPSAGVAVIKAIQQEGEENVNGNGKSSEGVRSAPNGGGNGTGSKTGGNGNITRAVLAQKYLVQFEDNNVAEQHSMKNNNYSSISLNNVSSNRNNNTPQPPHVAPTKVPLKCMKLSTKEVMQCKITLRDDRGVSILAAHQRLGEECADFVVPISELIVHPKYFYLISPATFGNLHSYIYSKSSLKETEAKSLFKQMVSIVNFCHSRGVILRDLKLGRFVFTDKERTTIKLESLEDVVILPNPDSSDDSLDDRHGCPNYVSPEKTECVVRNGAVKYSGKSSDVWALGISLYAMLAGRYPFNETDCSRLLRKIRSGCYAPIDGISPFAKSLVRCLLAKNPSDRPGCKEVLNHPWFRTTCDYKPTPQPTPVIRSAPGGGAITSSIRDDSHPLERDCSRAKRMRMSSDDDQVVPGC